MKNLIFLELNEINFDVVKYYINQGAHLPGYKKLLKLRSLNTQAEVEYEYLEPWIQWPSIHTGKTFNEHKVFRLGDFVNSTEDQFFEQVEKSGLSVGAVSPMNASNKLKKPAYFIPDPWTQTPSDDSYLSKIVTDSIIQAVNDNSQSKLTYKTIFNLIVAFFALIHPYKYYKMIKYALVSVLKPWKKALFLDIFLYEIHKTFYKRKKPNFSTLFLNAGAHLQHHYYFNSPFCKSSKLKNPNWYINKNEDPIFEMLKVYDHLITDLLSWPNTEIIIATGLSQKPYNEIKFYYRLKDHASFLSLIGIEFDEVAPRMTRDFLVSFSTVGQAKEAEKLLSSIMVENKVRLFGEIDNRGKDLFIILTYPSEITNHTKISVSGKEIFLNELVTFVAIKNGEHQSKGFAFFTDGISKFAPKEECHVCKIHNSILDFFDVKENKIRKV
jgi:hypothetical protein